MGRETGRDGRVVGDITQSNRPDKATDWRYGGELPPPCLVNQAEPCKHTCVS